jgi:hypothetical protein
MTHQNSRTTGDDAPDPITTSRYPYVNTGESGESQNRGTCMSPAQCSVSENDDTAKFARRDLVGDVRESIMNKCELFRIPTRRRVCGDRAKGWGEYWYRAEVRSGE